MLIYYCKYLLYRLGLAGWLYAGLFRYRRYRNRGKNAQFLREHPGIILPDDHFLFETFQPDYRKFIEDGAMAAKEILAWVQPYLYTNAPKILDWGCGPGRIIRHIPALRSGTLLYACDTSEEIIAWNRLHYTGIAFSTVNSFPPLLYAEGFFDLVYGFSVLTHIDAGLQPAWIEELHRVVQAAGIVVLTTHGSAYEKQLLSFQQAKLRAEGTYTQGFNEPGHRMMTTYHHAQFFRIMIEKYFTVLEYFDGTLHPQKAGGQDLWILRKK